MKLDYSLETSEERIALVEKILAETPNPSEKYLEILANYILIKADKNILTENRKITINKRETSYEGLVAQLENGEDGVYNLTDEGNRGALFKPKVSITKKDIESIPELRQVREAIDLLREKLKTAQGRDIFTIKHAIIELSKDQYIIKNSYYAPIQLNMVNKSHNYIPLDKVSLCDPKVCSAILCNYPELKNKSYGKFEEDTWYLLQDFERVYQRALRKYPEYQIICECKIMNMQNDEIQEVLREELGVSHSYEYISALWRHKIPELIASVAEDEYLDYYYLNVEKGHYKNVVAVGKLSQP